MTAGTYGWRFGYLRALRLLISMAKRHERGRFALDQSNTHCVDVQPTFTYLFLHHIHYSLSSR